MNISLRNPKVIFLLIFVLLVGCSTLQNWNSEMLSGSKKTPSSKIDSKKLAKLNWDTSPLFKEGTKGFSTNTDNILPTKNGAIKPCVDAKTGKPREFLLADVNSEVLTVSYSDMQHVVDSLTLMGLKTLLATVPQPVPYTVNSRGQKSFLPPEKDVKKQAAKYTCADLPIFYQPKTAPIANLTEVIKNQTPPAYGQTGSQFSFVAMTPIDYGLNQSLIVFYHPENRDRLDHVKDTLKTSIDTAPIQVYIESMILEVAESGFERLGVLYANTVPAGKNSGGLNQNLSIGATSPSTVSAAKSSSDSSLIKGVFTSGQGAASIAELLSITVQAMLADGQAEVLSRPSVIALNNRPAVIEVSDQKQYPIRTANAFPQGSAQFSYSFQEVSPGILLQIRPRISDVNNEVAMEIDVQVKALRAENDGEAKNDADEPKVIATKPGSTTRRVHTFAIVPNKTPIIIGGLVSKEKNITTNKIPFLGDIPYLGKLFGSTAEDNIKSEVIVVITPHIIRESGSIGIQTPKDTAMFDDMDNSLFRDSYRVRSEDMFDLGFVYQSEKFKRYRDYVVKRAIDDSAFSRTSLALDYSGKQFPGGDALVSRMIYDIVGKRDLANPVSRDKIILTEHAGDGNFKDVTFLEKAWKKAKSKSSLAGQDGKGAIDYGLELSFGQKHTGSAVQPHVGLRLVPRSEISLLTEVTKHDKNPSRIFIGSEKDLKKIRKAIVVREILKLNRSKQIIGPLNEFRKGQKLILPVINEERYFLLDKEVATVYHHTKFYYEILEEALRKSFDAVEKEIQKEENVAKAP